MNCPRGTGHLLWGVPVQKIIFTLLTVTAHIAEVSGMAPLCLPCEPGQGVLTECNNTHPTVCTPCADGSFSDTRTFFNACVPCTDECGPGQFELQRCTSTTDRVCQWCSKGKYKHNSDYVSRCRVLALERRAAEPPGLARVSADDAMETAPPSEYKQTLLPEVPAESLAVPDLAEEEEEEGVFIDPEEPDAVVGITDDWGFSGREPETKKEKAQGTTGANVPTFAGGRTELDRDALVRDELLPEVPASGGRPGDTDGEMWEFSGSGVGGLDLADVTTETVTNNEPVSTTEPEPETRSHSHPGTSRSSAKTPDKEVSDETDSGLTDLPHTDRPGKITEPTVPGEKDDIGKLILTPTPLPSTIASREFTSFAPVKEPTTKSANLAVIIPVVIVCVAGIILIVFVVLKCRKRKAKKGYIATSQDPEADPASFENNKEPLPTDSTATQQTEMTPLTTKDANGTTPTSDDVDVSVSSDQVPTKYQSPININTGDAIFDDVLEKSPLKFDCKSDRCPRLSNTGTTLKLEFPNTESTLSGGPLEQPYRLSHCQLHWGSDNTRGSDHSIDHKFYPAELHLCYWNPAHETQASARLQEDGQVVVAILLQTGAPQKGLKELTDRLSEVQYNGQNSLLPPDVIKLADLLPENKTSYWSYSGSNLDTPQSENVIWIIMQQTLELSEEQLTELRRLRSEEEGHVTASDSGSEAAQYITDNYRAQTDVHDRTIKASFSDKSR